MANHEIELQVAPMSDETMQHKKSVILLMLLPAMSTS